MAVENNVLKATVRKAGSKGAARAARREGLVPGIVYGGQVKDLAVAVSPAALEAVLRTEYAYNAVFTIEIEGEGSHKVMVRELQFDSVRRKVTHVDFKVVTADERIVVEVPVVTTGRSRGVAQGGRLDVVRREVKVSTTVENIPVDIKHDVTPLGIGEQVYIDEMESPEGSEFLFNHRYPVIRVVRRRGAKAEEEENGAAEATE